MTAEAQLWLIDHAPIMGGAEAFLLKIARHAGRRRDVRPVVLCPGASELAQRCRAADVEVWPLAMPHFASAQAVGIPAAIARMARLLRRAPPGTGLVGASAWSQALLAACAPWLPGRRIVHLLAEQDTAARASARLVLRRFGAPVTIGHNAARTYAVALARDDVVAVNNVLGEDELAAAATAPRRTASSARAAAGSPVVGVLARLIPDKGVLELVDELAACAGAWGQARLAGPAQDPGYAGRIKRAIAGHGLGDRIRLCGRVDSVTGFLDGLDALVVPSTGTEGQPTVVLEALARGVDVIVRDAVFSDDYRGLPVTAYRDPPQLRAALAALPAVPAPLEEIARRFGPGQALDGLLAAVCSPAALCRRD
jgi:glycosyltransferase involved in cell wall biosynthesis